MTSSPFATIRTAEQLGSLPADSVVVAYGPTRAIEVFHKQESPTGVLAWYTTGVSRALTLSEVPLPARLVFIPIR